MQNVHELRKTGPSCYAVAPNLDLQGFLPKETDPNKTVLYCRKPIVFIENVLSIIADARSIDLKKLR